MLLLCSIFILISAWFTSQLKFSYDYEDFFPKGDSDLDFYYQYREKFEHDDNFLLIGFKNDGGIFNQTFLSALDTATNQISKIEFAERTYSITNFRYFIKSPFGFIDYPALHVSEPARYKEDSLRIRLDERLNGKLISPDFQTTIIYIKTLDTLTQTQSEQFLSELQTIVQNAGLKDPHFLGKVNFRVELAGVQKKEFLLYSILSLLLVSIVTYLMFRSVWCVLICLFTVAVALILFTGFLGLLGYEQNIMSTLYPIVIIIIGISDAVHFLGKYIVELRNDHDRKTALLNTLQDVGAATFLTAITSAIGFLTMLTSNVIPLREFGIFSAFGVLIAYFVVLFITSPLLKLFSLKQLEANKKSDKINWDRFINFIYLSGKKHPRNIIIGMTVLLILFGFGISRISTDIHLEAGMPKHAKVTEDFHFFEENFNGFRPFEIAAVANGNHEIDDPEILREIDKVETFAKDFEIINGLQSVTMIYKSLNRAYHADQPDAYKLPDDSLYYSLFKNDLRKFKLNELNVLISEDKKYGRITGYLSDAGTDSIQAVQKQIENYIEANTDTSKVKFEITGTGIIFDKNTDYLRRNIISGVLLAFLCIGILMSVMFKNWKMVIISIIPNILPLFACAGIMGLLQIELDAPTSIIFGISYGIAVDDTIHFLSKFKIERSKGHSVEDAIQFTFQETGKAVINMSVILLFGFLILMVSSTAATFNIGLLTGVTLFSAVWPDLLLLPMMLRKWIH